MNQKLDLNVKSFISSIIVIVVLMFVAYGLTFLLPAGQYTRIIDEAGHAIIDTSVPFTTTVGNLTFIKFLFSPILVLGAEGNITLIEIIIFLLVIGGIFNCLTKSQILNYSLSKMTHKYSDSRYKLLYIISLFFMLMGSLIGSAEEIIPLVPIITSLTVSLGFDALTGLGISTLAGSCGFSSGISNPFTIGIAQEIAGLPMFSGVWYRIVVFIIEYILLMYIVIGHAKKVEKKQSEIVDNFVLDERLDKASNSFVIIMGIGIVICFSSIVITALQDYTLIIFALMFLIAGNVSCALAKLPIKEFFKTFFEGVKEMLPVVFMILMASSVRYILEEAMILDTIIYYIMSVTVHMPKWSIILFIYLIFLVLEIFIASGSAKAFLLMPLVLPVAQVSGISSQLTILAFAFGDGFSNELYPTNPGLIISLNLANVNMIDYFKYTFKFIVLNLIITVSILLFGLYIGY